MKSSKLNDLSWISKNFKPYIISSLHGNLPVEFYFLFVCKFSSPSKWRPKRDSVLNISYRLHAYIQTLVLP